jgi:hypothetical protein
MNPPNITASILKSSEQVRVNEAVKATKPAPGVEPPLLPWSWQPEGSFILDATGNQVAEIPCQGCDLSNGPFIVTACNEHAALKAELATAANALTIAVGECRKHALDADALRSENKELAGLLSDIFNAYHADGIKIKHYEPDAIRAALAAHAAAQKNL